LEDTLHAIIAEIVERSFVGRRYVCGVVFGRFLGFSLGKEKKWENKKIGALSDTVLHD
jgi:hypothetical protein